MCGALGAVLGWPCSPTASAASWRRGEAAGGPAPAWHPAPTTPCCSTTATNPSRIPPPAGSPTACTVEPRLRPGRLRPGTTSSGAGASSPAPCSTNCTSARSRPAPRSTPPIERLDHLVDLGITHVEVMPVNAVNGVWNWGYDGVDWYAVHEPLGGPDGFKRFVDAAHGKGLAVDPGRRLQPPRSVRELPAAVRAVPEVRTQHVGRPGQRRGTRGARLHHRQRADVAAGLSRRRVAPGCRARAAGRLADPHPRRARDAGRRAARSRSAGR